MRTKEDRIAELTEEIENVQEKIDTLMRRKLQLIDERVRLSNEEWKSSAKKLW